MFHQIKTFRDATVLLFSIFVKDLTNKSRKFSKITQNLLTTYWMARVMLTSQNSNGPCVDVGVSELRNIQVVYCSSKFYGTWLVTTNIIDIRKLKQTDSRRLLFFIIIGGVGPST
jgi:hypothetical protein